MYIFLFTLPFLFLAILLTIRIVFQKYRFFRTFGLLSFVFYFLVTLYVCFCFFNGIHSGITTMSMYSNVFWWSKIFNWGITLSMDGVSACFILLSSFVFVTCGLSLWRRDGDVFEFLGLLFWLQAFIGGFFLTQDLLMLYVFFEASIIPMYLLIGRWGSGSSKIVASYYFLLYTLIGSSLMLYAICSIYLALGTTDFSVILRADFSKTTSVFYFFFFFIGFAVKVPLFPFHLWLPEAHVQAPTEGSVLLSAVLLKMGVYGIYKVCYGCFYSGCLYFAPLIRAFAIVGVLYSSFSAFIQLDMKRIIAYSSIAHTNLTVLGMFSFNVEGIHGGLILSIAHGLVSAALFFLIGFLYDRYGTRNVNAFGGLSQVMPLFNFFFLFFVLCNIGTPLSLNFIGEFLIFVGVFKHSFFLCLLSAFSVFSGLLYSFWLYLRIMSGSLKVSYVNSFFDLTKVEFFILLPYAACLLCLGVYTKPILFMLACV